MTLALPEEVRMVMQNDQNEEKKREKRRISSTPRRCYSRCRVSDAGLSKLSVTGHVRQSCSSLRKRSKVLETVMKEVHQMWKDQVQMMSLQHVPCSLSLGLLRSPRKSSCRSRDYSQLSRKLGSQPGHGAFRALGTRPDARTVACAPCVD